MSWCRPLLMMGAVISCVGPAVARTPDAERVQVTDPVALQRMGFPAGVRLDFVRWWANDSDAADDLVIALLESCHPDFGAGPTSTTQIGIGGTTGSSGNQGSTLTLTRSSWPRRSGWPSSRTLESL